MKKIKSYTVLPFDTSIIKKLQDAGLVKDLSKLNKDLVIQDMPHEAIINHWHICNRENKKLMKAYRDIIEIKTIFFLFQIDYCGLYQVYREELEKNGYRQFELNDYKFNNKYFQFEELAKIFKIDKQLQKLNNLKYIVKESAVMIPELKPKKQKKSSK